MISDLRERFDKLEGQIERLKQVAIDLGANPSGLHLENVVRTIERYAKEKLEAEDKAREAGYKSVLIALKAVGQKSTFANVPSELTVAPSTWVVPRSISEIQVGGKTVRRTNPQVTAVQAQKKLKSLLPMIQEFCEGASPESVESLKDGFYSLSYEAFSEELMQVIAKDRGRGVGVDSIVEKTGGQVTSTSSFEPLGLPVGELILSYQGFTERWLKDNTDFNRMVKESTYPVRLDLVEEASALDSFNDNQNAEIASLLIPTAFFELCGIGLEEVTGYEMSHSGELPTQGKDFLHRLRKIGLGPSIKDYCSAMTGSVPE